MPSLIDDQDRRPIGLFHRRYDWPPEVPLLTQAMQQDDRARIDSLAPWRLAI
jgi:hypothetical protein